MDCPKCNKSMIGCEYSYNHYQHYDGISEWQCEPCKLRIGRWSKKELMDHECEFRFNIHPTTQVKEPNETQKCG